MSTALAGRIAQEHQAAFVALAPDSPEARRRRDAIEAVQSRGLPTSRDENWKYANLRSMERVRFAPPATRRSGAIGPSALPARIPGYTRYTFVDGAFAAELSSPQAQPGVSIQRLPAGEPRAGDADERFALLNEAFATEGAYVITAAESGALACVECVFVASEEAQAAASYPRLEIQAGAGSRVGVIERHLSSGSDANFVNGAVKVDVGAGATVEHYRVQHSGARATWIDTLAAAVARDGNYDLHLINLGAGSARSTMHVALNGERARLNVYSASVAHKQQVHDAYALVEHVAPSTLSRQSFRGIAAGRSRVGFNSKVVVREGAIAADSYQSLRGLLAGPDAEIDVRPQLEIYTDDVRCAHGATAGKLDEAMLFYLLSRGIDRDTAQVLLKWAFLEDVVARITVPELRKQIEQSLAAQMTESAALGELL